MARTRVMRPVGSERSAEAERLGALARVVKGCDAFVPARSVLRRVEAVPTVFIGADWATHVGGQPIRRVQTVHGVSNHGKTLYTIGVGGSFLRAGNFFKLWDAERTTSITWIEGMLGSYADHPGFHANKPATYEAFRDDFRQWATSIGEWKAKGLIPKDVTGLGVLDCINKLTPKDFFTKLNASLKKQIEDGVLDDEAKQKGSRRNAKTSKAGHDGANGMAGRIKAQLNTAFLNEAIPLCDDCGVAMMIIARESENSQTSSFSGEDDYKVLGGKSVIYDASLRTRIERAGWVYKGGKYDKESDSNPVFGERIRVVLKKTKVAGKEGRESVGYFHTSNGVHIPVGFDRARDLIEYGQKAGVVTLKGSSYNVLGKKWQGVDNAVAGLTRLPDLMNELEALVRAEMPNENRDAEEKESDDA